MPNTDYMPIHLQASMLDAHGIDYEIENDRILVKESHTLYGRVYPELVDVTDLSSLQLADWLQRARRLK